MEVYKSTHTSEAFNFALSAVPSIGENGNWFIGDQDTGVLASGIQVSGAEVGQTIKVSEVNENGVPIAWEATALEETWELVVDVTIEEAVNTISTGLFSSPQKKIRIIIDTPAADADTNYMRVTVWTGNAEWNTHIGFYAIPLPLKTAQRENIEVQIVNETDALVRCASVQTGGKGYTPDLPHVAKTYEALWTPIDSYGNQIKSHITGLTVLTYGMFAVGAKLQVWGVKA